MAFWDNTMVRWNWKTNTWKCNACGAENNPPLANFCSQCGSLADKVPLVAAPIAPAESCPPKEYSVLLRNPDSILNIFGVALVVEKTTGNMVVFPDPFRESTPFFLSHITEGIAQVRFDQWWIYVLNTQGNLYVFPVSALSSDYMAMNTNWWPCAENVQKFSLFKNRLLVLDETSRRIKIGDTPSIYNFWAEREESAYKPREIDTPFDIETLVPLQGEDFIVALVGKNNMALLTDEGVSEPYEGFLDDGKSHWVGSNREGLLRLAFRQGDGGVGIISFAQDNPQILQETIPDLQAGSLYIIEIDGQYWFAVITSDIINLVDPLNSNVDIEYPAFMSQTDLCSSFGNLVAGFQDNEDPGGLPLMALFHFDRNSDISRLRFWSLKTGLTPMTAPAGFGHSVYVLMKEENDTMLYCYSLNGDREA